MAEPKKRGRPAKPKEVEVWKDIVGYEGFYQVSNAGRIKSLERRVKNSGALGQEKTITKHELVKKQSFNHQGYCQVSLMKSGQRKHCRVHRVVAEHFLEPASDDACEVNHIDGDKTNNNAINLEWVTPSENTRHAISTGLRKNLSEGAKERISAAQKKIWKSDEHRKQRTKYLKKRFELQPFKGNTFPTAPVMCIETEEIFPSVRDAAQRYGVTTSAISAAARGKCKTCKNYQWRYI